MEINKFSDILGVVATEDIVEGRLVFITTHSEDYDFGSRVDLPGVKLPDDSDDSDKSKYVSAFQVNNRNVPIYEPTPSFSLALRQGFDQDSNVPFDATVHLTAPGNKEGQTIPSGEVCLAFAGGVFTVPSGAFIYHASLAAGAFLVVANTADDSAGEAGQLKYSATAGIAIVERYDATNNRLTFRTLQP